MRPPTSTTRTGNIVCTCRYAGAPGLSTRSAAGRHGSCTCASQTSSAGKQLELAVDRHVLQPGSVDPLANRVVVLAVGGVELLALHVDRPFGEEVVSAAVIGVEVRVDDDVYACEVELLLVQRVEEWVEGGDHRRVPLRHAGVDQDPALGVVDDVHADGHDLALDVQLGDRFDEASIAGAVADGTAVRLARRDRPRARAGARCCRT